MTICYNCTIIFGADTIPFESIPDDVAQSHDNTEDITAGHTSGPAFIRGYILCIFRVLSV